MKLNYTPSWAEISKHYYAACAMFRRKGSHVSAHDESRLQAYHRKVHVEFHRRLKVAGIYVEGA